MEKLRSYMAPASSLKTEYSKLSQSTTDEHEHYCINCSHSQEAALQAQQSPFARSWLALWTIATLLFGVLIVFILLLAKEYTFHCSLTSQPACPNQLLSDQAFGEIPMRRVVWKMEPEFVDVDPMEGQNWGHFGDEKNESKWTAWDDIYDGSWVSIEPDETLGIPPGVPIQKFSEEAGESWRTPKHGYSPSINHQIHCLGWVKHYLMPGGSQDINYEHAGHCVEYLRHAIMCAGDLTLEAPEHPTRTHLLSYSYDETVHVCRDWTAMSSALRNMALGFEVGDDRGLIPFDHSGWQPKRPVVPFEAV